MNKTFNIDAACMYVCTNQVLMEKPHPHSSYNSDIPTYAYTCTCTYVHNTPGLQQDTHTIHGIQDLRSS